MMNYKRKGALFDAGLMTSYLGNILVYINDVLDFKYITKNKIDWRFIYYDFDVTLFLCLFESLCNRIRCNFIIFFFYWLTICL